MRRIVRILLSVKLLNFKMSADRQNGPPEPSYLSLADLLPELQINALQTLAYPVIGLFPNGCSNYRVTLTNLVSLLLTESLLPKICLGLPVARLQTAAVRAVN